MGLETKLIWVYIGIGVIANVITGLFLMPLLKAFWERLNRPVPLTLAGKVQLAQQIEAQERYLERLNHLSANPRDMYFHICEMVVVTFLCLTGAECIFIWRMKEALPAGLILLVMGLVLGIATMFELRRLSVKNIDRTKAKAQKWIDDAKAKLDPPSFK